MTSVADFMRLGEDCPDFFDDLDEGFGGEEEDRRFFFFFFSGLTFLFLAFLAAVLLFADFVEDFELPSSSPSFDSDSSPSSEPD